MKILFLTDAYPNYVPDLLLHGLRKMLGPNVVDYPKKDCLYAGVIGLGICPPDQLAPGWFPADSGAIDRDDIEKKVQTDFFDLIVSDVRSLSLLNNFNLSPRVKLVIIDGEDHPAMIRPGNYIVFCRETDGSDHNIPLPMAIPEEIIELIEKYDQEPKRYSIGFLGSTEDSARKTIVREICASFQDTLFATTHVPTADNIIPQGRLGRIDYYHALQSCYFVLSLPGMGFDTFRFWENASMNSVHLAFNIPIFIPHPFRDNMEILFFDQAEELRRKIDHLLQNDNIYSSILHKGRQHLRTYHTTTARALYFINKCRQTFGF